MRRAILVAALATLVLPAPALAQTEQELPGYYLLRANPPGAEPCIQSTAEFRVNSVSGQTLNVTYGPVDGALAWDPARRAFRGELGTSTFRVNLDGAFSREPDKVRVVMNQRVVGESCVSRLEGAKDAPLTAATTPPAPAAPPLGSPAAAPGSGETPGMDPPAGPAPDEVVLFGQGETNLLLILAGVLFVTGFLFSLLGGRRPRRMEKPEAFVQTPVMASPPTTPAPTPQTAPPPAAPAAPEPAPPTPAPDPEPEPKPEPVSEPAVEPEPDPEPEPQPAPAPAPVAEPEPEPEPEAPLPPPPKARARKAPARSATGKSASAKAKAPSKPKAPRKPAK